MEGCDGLTVGGPARRMLMVAIFGSLALAQAPQGLVVTSAASFQVGLPPKGSLGTIFCTGLTVHGITTAGTIPLPRTLAGVSVTAGGAPAPLLAVAEQTGYQMINFQVPQEAKIAGDNTAVVTVAQNGNEGSTQVTLSSSPGDFFTAGGGPNGIFLHSTDFSPVTKDKPARASEILIGYLTGLPSVAPVVPTGEPAPVFPAALVPQPQNASETDTFSLSVNGLAVANTNDAINVPFLGLTPGLEGVYQVDFIVPAGLPAGNASVYLTRTTCHAVFGSCLSGGGTSKVVNGNTVLLAIQ